MTPPEPKLIVSHAAVATIAAALGAALSGSPATPTPEPGSAHVAVPCVVREGYYSSIGKVPLRGCEVVETPRTIECGQRGGVIAHSIDPRTELVIRCDR